MIPLAVQFVDLPSGPKTVLSVTSRVNNAVNDYDLGFMILDRASGAIEDFEQLDRIGGDVITNDELYSRVDYTAFPTPRLLFSISSIVHNEVLYFEYELSTKTLVVNYLVSTSMFTFSRFVKARDPYRYFHAARNYVFANKEDLLVRYEPVGDSFINR